MDRLESWKEIARHLRRQVRTVQRWEREEGLPVHRHHHQQRGTVYAFSEELDAWQVARGATASPEASQLPAEGNTPPSCAAPEPDERTAAPSESPPGLRSAERRDRATRVGFGAVAALFGLGLLVLVVEGGPAPGPSAHLAVEPVSADADELAIGEYLLHRDQPEQVTSAVRAFERAARIAPADWRARAGLAQALIRSGHEGMGPPRNLFPRAREAARLARSLSPTALEPLVAEAWVKFEYDWRLPEAEAELRAALARRRDLPFALQGLAQLLSAEGRHDEAIELLHEAQRSQPLSAALNIDGCWFYFRARRFAEAEGEAQRALILEPDSFAATLCALDAQQKSGAVLAARDTAARLARDLGARGAEGVFALAPRDAFRFWYHLRMESLDRAREKQYIPPGAFADLYALMGDRDRAFSWLEMSFEQRDPCVLFLAVHPDFDALRGDPRLAELERRMG